MFAWLSKIFTLGTFTKICVPELSITEISSYKDYCRHVYETEAQKIANLLFEKSLIPDKGNSFTFNGYCYTCRTQVDFMVDFEYSSESYGVIMPNWRERLVCPRCHLNNRMRAIVHVFNQECKPNRASNIYITEQTTALYKVFKRLFPHIVASEYLGEDVAYGVCNSNGIRNENLTMLSFGGNKFDHILSFDVFEHIPNYTQALAECFRCLKPGGRLFFSVPFVKTSEKNIIRAYVSNSASVVHLLPPEYHGDPLQSDGCLCYYHFGWELLDELSAIGFTDTKSLLYWSSELGYLGGEQVILMATKGS